MVKEEGITKDEAYSEDMEMMEWDEEGVK